MRIKSFREFKDHEDGHENGHKDNQGHDRPPYQVGLECKPSWSVCKYVPLRVSSLKETYESIEAALDFVRFEELLDTI